MIVAGTALLATANPAHAEPPIAIRVRVDAAPSCADEARFWTALRLRSDRLARADDEGPARPPTIEVAIATTREGAVGDLRIVRGGVRSDARRVTAASCSEAVDGLGLVAALAFDPAAKIVLEEAPAAEPLDEPPSSPAAPAPAPARDVGPSEPRPRSTPADAPRSRWAFQVGVNGGAAGVGNGPALAWGAFVEANVDRGGLSPSLRLGATRTVSSTETPSVTTDLAWHVVRASLSPLRVDLDRAVSVRPVVVVEGGVFDAAARGFDGARAASRPWAALGLQARVAYTPVRRLFVELAGGATVPLVRDELVVDPGLFLYRAPALVASAEAAVGLHFP